MGLLGLNSDSVTSAANPRDLAMLLQGFDASKTFGLSVVPARTSLAPMGLRTYAEGGWLARAVGNTSLSYAQSTVTVQGVDYRQRAFAIGTSVALDDDDPVVAYARRLQRTSARVQDIVAKARDRANAAIVEPDAGKRMDAIVAAWASAQADLSQLAAAEPCFLIPTIEAPPGGDPAAVIEAAKASPAGAPGPRKPAVDAAGQAELAARVKSCHDDLDARARWNASHAWLSFATGNYRPASEGANHGLGRTLVAGLSWGFGNAIEPATTDASSDGKKADNASTNGGALTLGYRRTWKEPVLETYGQDWPDTRDTNLVTVRVAYGTNKMRVLAEGSNSRDAAPTSSQRTYKRALGLDLQVGKGMWFQLRYGRQRRVDDSGDETGASLAITLNPTASLVLN